MESIVAFLVIGFASRKLPENGRGERALSGATKYRLLKMILCCQFMLFNLLKLQPLIYIFIKKMKIDVFATFSLNPNQGFFVAVVLRVGGLFLFKGDYVQVMGD